MALLRRLGPKSISRTVFMLCDVQERLAPHIHGIDDVVHICNRMLGAAKVFGVPVLVSEQYPKALGHTVTSIDLTDEKIKVYEKTRFSMITPEIGAELKRMQAEGDAALPLNAVLFGTEAHVCILQTAFDLLEMGAHVYVLTDATSSQTPLDRSTAFLRLQQSGVALSTSESLLFELMEDKNFKDFKAVSALVKDRRADAVLPQNRL